MKKYFYFSLALVFVLSLSLGATDFRELGSRSSAMGGSYTGLAENSIGVQFNPAGLSQQRGFDVQIPFGLGLLTTKDLLKYTDEMYKIADEAELDFDDAGDMSTEDYANATKFLAAAKNLTQKGQGVIVNANAGLNIRWKNWAFTANNYTMIAGQPLPDLENVSFFSDDTNDELLDELDDWANNQPGYGTRTLSDEEQAVADQLKSKIDEIITVGYSENLAKELVWQAKENGVSLKEIEAALPLLVEIAASAQDAGDTSGSIDDNNSELRLNGIALTEVALSYGRPMFLENLNIGFTLKMMRGDVGYFSYIVSDSEIESDDIMDDFDEDKEASTTFGIDVGAMYALNNFKAGLVIKNINSPKFKNTSDASGDGYGDIKFSPQVRAGVSYKPWQRVILTSDLDLTANKTIMSDYKSQMFGMGAEFNLLQQRQKKFNMALRCGFKTNLAESDEGMIFTGGLGFSLLHMQLDLAGSMSSKKTAVDDGDEVPTNFSVGGTLSLNF